MSKRLWRAFGIGAVVGGVLSVLVVGVAWNVWWRSVPAPEEGETGQLFGREEGVSRASSLSDDELRYTHPRYGFSVVFPKELAVARYPQGNASETVVFQKPGAQEGFQVFITPHVGNEITEERLSKDVKGGVIEAPTEVVIGGGQRALIFWSEDSAVGRLREVWFIHDGFLYEVTTYAELDDWLANILNTWRFAS